jgi:Ca-activated chloride channel family protein
MTTIRAVLSLIVFVFGAAVAQEFTVKVTSNLVLLDVSVKGPTGYIAGLGKENFQIVDSGKPQTITHFSHDDVPVTVGLVIDTSGSMTSKYNQVVTAALVFMGASNPKDELFVVNFNDYVKFGLPPDMPFSDDVYVLRPALSMVKPEGRTALYDAVVQALDHLDKSTQDKKTLLLVSDGGDNHSIHTLADVVRKVEVSRATIYTIGLFDENDLDRNPKLLHQLSGISGGETYLPKDVSEVTSICRQIAADIRARYTVGYVPAQVEGQALHKVKLTASQSGGGKLKVHTRTSYLVP